MKRFLALILAIIFVLGMSACGENNDKPTNNDTPSSPASSVESTIDTTSSDSTSSDASAPDTSSSDASTPNASVSSSQPSDNQHTHTWGNWKRKTFAFIDKEGSDERACSTCSATETRKRTENAIANSFHDGGLQYIIWGGNATFNASSMYQYACHEFHSYIEKEGIPAADVFALLSKCFNVTEKDKEDIKKLTKTTEYNNYGYNATNDTFFLPYNAETGNFLFLGYKHNGSNKYTTYYSYSDFSFDETEESIWSFEVEYNRSKGQPNKYSSAKKVTATPSDMIKTDGWVEFEGPIAK